MIWVTAVRTPQGVIAAVFLHSRCPLWAEENMLLEVCRPYEIYTTQENCWNSTQHRYHIIPEIMCNLVAKLIFL